MRTTGSTILITGGGGGIGGALARRFHDAGNRVIVTGLTPGQESREGYMRLEDYVDEAMALFARVPTPPEILVERVGFQRFAEREGRFDAGVTQLNDAVRRAREAQKG